MSFKQAAINTAECLVVSTFIRGHIADEVDSHQRRSDELNRSPCRYNQLALFGKYIFQTRNLIYRYFAHYSVFFVKDELIRRPFISETYLDYNHM